MFANTIRWKGSIGADRLGNTLQGTGDRNEFCVKGAESRKRRVKDEFGCTPLTSFFTSEPPLYLFARFVCEISLRPACAQCSQNIVVCALHARVVSKIWSNRESCPHWPYGLWGVIGGKVTCPGPAGLEGHRHHRISKLPLLDAYFQQITVVLPFEVTLRIAHRINITSKLFADVVVLQLTAPKVASATTLPWHVILSIRSKKTQK